MAGQALAGFNRSRPEPRGCGRQRPDSAPRDAVRAATGACGAAVLAVLLLAGHGVALAQGAYVGSIEVRYNEGNRLKLRGVVQASLPLTRADDRYFSAELDGPPAQASVRLAEMETFQTAGAPDSAGRIYTDTCKLAAPVEVPLGVFGGLVVDRREKAARMNILFSSLDEVTLDCVHSVSGPHKGRVTVSFSVGTHENGVLYEGLPIADPAHLVVTHAMVPGPGMTSDDIRSEQKWDLRLER